MEDDVLAFVKPLRSMVEWTGELGQFFWRVTKAIFSRPFEWAEFSRQLDAIGARSLTLVALAGAATGAVLALQTRDSLARFGAKSMLPAVIVLAFMILPTITAISRDALVSVPPKLRMAAYGLGATRWEAIIAVILPTAARGIFGGMVLAFGRALGETMALAMLVGNSNRISVSLFSPANTLAALLANNFPEAGPREVGVLMYAALVLLAITLIVNIFGALILQRAARSSAE